jgi:hypothetical protein
MPEPNSSMTTDDRRPPRTYRYYDLIMAAFVTVLLQ